MFEIHVVLLSLADAERHLVEEGHHLRQQVRRDAAEQAVGADQHGVARENGHVLPPACEDRGLAAPHGRVVHDVVVQQGEVVEHLDGGGGRQGLLQVVGEQAAREHHEHRSQPLATPGERVADGCVEPFGFSREFGLRQVILNDGEELLVVLHVCLDVFWSEYVPKVGKNFGVDEFSINFDQINFNF